MTFSKEIRVPNENLLIIQGRMSNSPKLFDAGEHKVARFSIAWNWRGPSKQPHFFDVECWRKTAENVAQFYKGQPVQIRGRIEHQTYEKEGEKISRFVIVADRVESLVWPERTNAPQETETADENIGADDIPF